MESVSVSGFRILTRARALRPPARAGGPQSRRQPARYQSDRAPRVGGPPLPVQRGSLRKVPDRLRPLFELAGDRFCVLRRTPTTLPRRGSRQKKMRGVTWTRSPSEWTIAVAHEVRLVEASSGASALKIVERDRRPPSRQAVRRAALTMRSTSAPTMPTASSGSRTGPHASGHPSALPPRREKFPRDHRDGELAVPRCASSGL